MQDIFKKPKAKVTLSFGGNTAFIWTMADWQLGKADLWGGKYP